MSYNFINTWVFICLHWSIIGKKVWPWTSLEWVGRGMECINLLLSPSYFLSSFTFISEFQSLWKSWNESPPELRGVWSGSRAAEILKQPFSVPGQLCLVAFRGKKKRSVSSIYVCIRGTEPCAHVTGDLSRCSKVLWPSHPKSEIQTNAKSLRDTSEMIWLLRISY